MDLQISERFAFHPADTTEKQEAHKEVRAICRDAAEALDYLLPDGREKSTCITKLQEAMMHGNAALAINGGPAEAYRGPKLGEE